MPCIERLRDQIRRRPSSPGSSLIYIEICIHLYIYLSIYLSSDSLLFFQAIPAYVPYGCLASDSHSSQFGGMHISIYIYIYIYTYIHDVSTLTSPLNRRPYLPMSHMDALYRTLTRPNSEASKLSLSVYIYIYIYTYLSIYLYLSIGLTPTAFTFET